MRISHLIRYSFILTTMFLVGCNYKSAKTKAETPPKVNPIKNIETVKSKTIKPKHSQTQPIQPEAVKPEAVKPEPVKPEPVKTELVQRLVGKVSLDQSKLKRKNAELANTIVYFEPLNVQYSQLLATDAVISTQNKKFKPSVLAITAGSKVNFPNMDRILHNVFSVSPESDFDLGLYSAGTSKSVTFDEPGVIYVHCNVHHSMQADILVLDTPYFTQVDGLGNFELNGLPELEGTLKTWHPRANIESLQLTENSNLQNIQQTVVITRPEVPKHRNKFGNSYRRTRY